MDPFDLMDAGVTALATDSTLQGWCQSWYGKDIEVFIDQDVSNPPGQDDCPSIQFHSPGKSVDEFKKGVTYSYLLLIGVEDTEDETRAESNVNQFKGTARLTAIIERAIAVIREAKPNSNFVLSAEYETDTISLFPVHFAEVLITFIEDDHWRPGIL
jgi:hypothetical protein